MNLKSISATTVCFAMAAAVCAAQQRPKITGISHLATYTSDPAATEHYYVDIIGAAKTADPENPKGVRYMLSATQFVEVLPLPPNSGINRVDHSAWNTEDAEGLRKYLAAKGWAVPAHVTRGKDGSRWFEVLDPENNRVQFVQPSAHAAAPNAPHAIGTHIIHIGLMTHSREAEDKFYREMLGFRPYWFGAMKEGRVDWVSQQAPDGHDWLEYMLTYGNTPVGAASGIPAGMTLHDKGVLDHLSIGVVSVEAAHKTLEDGNRLGGTHDKHTQIGRDGKGQFNLYDPDGIRLELMNFHATEKPCCSDFTADDPAK